ncbi:hypothetical protein A2U01_0082849, partial [Trifolium medium]|nr:hypothetical protein [Trifolium medium]
EFSRSLWNYIGFHNLDFFSNLYVYDWLKLGQVHRLPLSQLASGGLGDTAT